jgi:hypothetical protein
MSFIGNLYLKAGIDAGFDKGMDFKRCGGANSGALLFGAGTSASPAATATADKKFVSLFTNSTATSGDSRNTYLRHYLSGAAGAGEALRAFTTINAVGVANAHGAHISLNLGAATYSVTGQGIGLRATLHVPNAAMVAHGTYAALQAEVYLDGTSSDPRTTTEFSLLRLIIDGGNAAAQAKVLNLMSLVNIPAGSGGGQMYSPGTSMGTVEGTLRILVNGVAKYIPVYGHEGHS